MSLLKNNGGELIVRDGRDKCNNADFELSRLSVESGKSWGDAYPTFCTAIDFTFFDEKFSKRACILARFVV